MVCSFFGHKDTPASIYPLLVSKIETLIQDRNVHSFLVGNQGAFDNMVLKALRELNHRYPSICYNVVLAYMPARRQEYELYDPAETFLPEGIESVPRRFAISWRNKWIANESEIIICYITHSWGGASQFVEYAQRQNKEIINLAQE